LKKSAHPPDPRTFPDELARVLALLNIVALTRSEPWVSTSWISGQLLDQYAIGINVRRVYSLLSKNPGFVARRKRNDGWQFRILEDGTRRLQSPPTGVVLVDPSQPIPAIIELHGFLRRLTGTVRVCDPYLDPVTLTHLDALRPAVRLLLLTQRIREEATVRAALGQFSRFQRTVSIKRSTSGVLHDRYIIDDRSAFQLGTSLNGFGKSQSTIISLGSDVRMALLKAFEGEWNAAAIWQ
jgi:hypothetical protein